MLFRPSSPLRSPEGDPSYGSGYARTPYSAATILPKVATSLKNLMSRFSQVLEKRGEPWNIGMFVSSGAQQAIDSTRGYLKFGKSDPLLAKENLYTADDLLKILEDIKQSKLPETVSGLYGQVEAFLTHIKQKQQLVEASNPGIVAKSTELLDLNTHSGKVIRDLLLNLHRSGKILTIIAGPDFLNSPLGGFIGEVNSAFGQATNQSSLSEASFASKTVSIHPDKLTEKEKADYKHAILHATSVMAQQSFDYMYSGNKLSFLLQESVLDRDIRGVTGLTAASAGELDSATRDLKTKIALMEDEYRMQCLNKVKEAQSSWLILQDRMSLEEMLDCLSRTNQQDGKFFENKNYSPAGYMQFVYNMFSAANSQINTAFTSFYTDILQKEAGSNIHKNKSAIFGFYGIDQSVNYDNVQLDGTSARRPDSTLHANDLEYFREITRQERLETLKAQHRNVGPIPFLKMFYGREVVSNDNDTVNGKGNEEELINKMLEKLANYGQLAYANDSELKIPIMEVAYVPYGKDSNLVCRATLNGIITESELPGMGGIARQIYKLFATNGQTKEQQASGQEVSAGNFDEMNQVIQSLYPDFIKDFEGYDRADRHTIFYTPQISKDEQISPANRLKNFVFKWLNRFIKSDKKADPTIKHERTLMLFDFGTASPLPASYEESRGRGPDPEKNKNAAVDFEKAMNAKLAELRNQGFDLTHYNLTYRAESAMPGLEGGKVRFVAMLQLDRKFKLDKDGNHQYLQTKEGKDEDAQIISKEEYDALTEVDKEKKYRYFISKDTYEASNEEDRNKFQLRFLETPEKEVRVVSDIMPYRNMISSQDAQNWIASPMNSLAEDIHEPNKNWLARQVTWGVNMNENISQAAAVRLLHSIILEKPDPNSKVSEKDSELQDVQFFSGVFRGPSNLTDPSQINFPGKDDVPLTDEQKKEFYTDEAKERHTMNDREVHELEWMTMGFFMDIIRRVGSASLIAGHMVRVYLEGHNFPGNVQGFNCWAVYWANRKKLPSWIHHA